MHPFLPLLLLGALSVTAAPEPFPEVENGFRLTERLLSGGQPEGDEDFAALAKAGVKLVLSVDGTPPDLELARKHGLRYAHVPVGYDGITTNQAARILRAAADAPGPVYLHCHHGKHRGPAAAALLLQGREGWGKAEAVGWLKTAGTSPEYAGLFACVRDFQTPNPAVLAAVGPVPELQSPEPMVDVMVRIDQAWEAIQTKPVPSQTLLLWEAYKEMQRLRLGADLGADFVAQVSTAESAARALHEAVAAGREPVAELKVVKNSCRECHKGFRN